MPAVSTGARRSRFRLAAVGALLIGAAMILATSASSQSITPQSVDPLQHFIDCAGVLISAPDIHAANCLPNNIPPETNSLVSSPDDKGCPLQFEPLDGVEDLVEDDDCGYQP